MDIGSLTGQIELEDQLSSGLTIVSTNISKFADRFDGLFGAVAVGAGAAAIAIAGVTSAVVALGNRGSDVNDVSATLDKFAGSVQNASNIMEQLRGGTLGTVRDFDLMKSSTKLLAAGVKLTADDFGTLSKAAFVLQNQGLGPTKDMLELVSQAMLRGNTRTLEQRLGFLNVKKAADEYAKSLGTTADKLTPLGQLEAKRIAILDLLKTKVREAGEQQRDFGEMMEFAVTQVRNFGDQIASAVAKSPQVMNAVRAIGDALAKAFGGDAQMAVQVIVSWINKFADFVAAYGPPVIRFIADVKDRIVEIWKNVVHAWSLVPDWFKNIAKEAVLAGGALYVTSQALKGITGGGDGSDTLGIAASFATITSGLYNLGQVALSIVPNIKNAAASIKSLFVVISAYYQLIGVQAILIALSAGFTALITSVGGIAVITGGFVYGLYNYVFPALDDLGAKWGLWAKRIDETTAAVKRFKGVQPIIDPSAMATDKLARAKAASEEQNKFDLAKYGPDLSDLVKVNEEVKKLHEKLSDQTAIKGAQDLMAALKGLKIPTLAREHLSEIATTLDKAIDHHRRMGTEAPKAWTATRDVAKNSLDAWKQLPSAIGFTFKMLEQAAAYKSPPPRTDIEDLSIPMLGGYSIAFVRTALNRAFHQRDLFSPPPKTAAIEDVSLPMLGGFSIGMVKHALSSLKFLKPPGPGIMEQIFGSPKEFGERFSQGIISAIQGGGNVGQTIGSMLGADIGKWAGEKLAKALGSKLGEALGGLLGPLGALGGQLLGSLIDKIFDRSKGRDAVKAFAETHGGFDEMHKMLVDKLGPAGEQFWIKLTQGVGRNNPEQAKKVIDEINDALGNIPKTMAQLAAEAGFKTQDELEMIAQDAVKLWEFMRDSGQFSAKAIQEAYERAQQALRDAGDEQALLTQQYTDSIKKLDEEYKSLADSIAGEAYEENMGVVEMQTRARMEQIEKEKKALQEQMDAGSKAAEEAQEDITAKAREVDDELRRIFERGYHVPVYFDYPDGRPEGRAPAGATVEANESGPQGTNSRAGGARGGGSVKVQIGPRVIAELVVPEIPGVVQEYHLG